MTRQETRDKRREEERRREKERRREGLMLKITIFGKFYLFASKKSHL